MKTLRIGALALCMLAAGSAVAMDDDQQKNTVLNEISALHTQLLPLKGYLPAKSQNELNELSDVVDILIKSKRENALQELTKICGILACFVNNAEGHKKLFLGKIRVKTFDVVMARPKQFIALGLVFGGAAIYGVYKVFASKAKTKSVDADEDEMQEVVVE